MSDVDVVYPRIDAALSLVENELVATRTEADAFEGFRSRLRRLEPTRMSGVTPAGPLNNGGTRSSDHAFRSFDPGEVEDAYRETVLAMDHYDRDYGEPLVENVRLEFGQAVGDLLDARVPISSVQRDVIDAAAEQALNERQLFARTLDAERDSLASVSDRLGRIERRFKRQQDGRPSRDGRSISFDELVSHIESISAERQRTLHQRPAAKIAGIDGRSLVEYLYGDDGHRFPALVEIADVAERIEAAADEAVPTVDPTLR